MERSKIQYDEKTEPEERALYNLIRSEQIRYEKELKRWSDIAAKIRQNETRVKKETDTDRDVEMAD